MSEKVCISHQLVIIDYEAKYVLITCEKCKHCWRFVADESFEDALDILERLGAND